MCVREVEGERCSTVQCGPWVRRAARAQLQAEVQVGLEGRCRRKVVGMPPGSGTQKWTVIEWVLLAGRLAGQAVSGRQC